MARACWFWRFHVEIHDRVPEVPASYCVGSSLADRIRVLTPEEWDRLAEP
jgi:hypothetical protein